MTFGIILPEPSHSTVVYWNFGRFLLTELVYLSHVCDSPCSHTHYNFACSFLQEIRALWSWGYFVTILAMDLGSRWVWETHFHLSFHFMADVLTYCSSISTWSPFIMLDKWCFRPCTSKPTWYFQACSYPTFSSKYDLKVIIAKHVHFCFIIQAMSLEVQAWFLSAFASCNLYFGITNSSSLTSFSVHIGTGLVFTVDNEASCQPAFSQDFVPRSILTFHTKTWSSLWHQTCPLTKEYNGWIRMVIVSWRLRATIGGLRMIYMTVLKLLVIFVSHFFNFQKIKEQTQHRAMQLWYKLNCEQLELPLFFLFFLNQMHFICWKL